jgi:hypothetical protein
MGLHPWMVGPVGFQQTSVQPSNATPLPGLESIGLKKERIGQSIITAQMSAWSGTDAKAGYAATIIFYLSLLAACLYIFLRQTGVHSGSPEQERSPRRFSLTSLNSRSKVFCLKRLSSLFSLLRRSSSSTVNSTPGQSPSFALSHSPISSPRIRNSPHSEFARSSSL